MLFKHTSTYYVTPAGKRCAKATPGAVKKRHRSKKWWGYVAGRKTPLSSNRAVALQMLAEKRREAEQGIAGQHARQRRRLLSEHLAEFEADLRASATGKAQRQPCEQHVAQVMSQLRLAVAGCKWTMPADLDAEQARRWLAEQGRDEEPPDFAGLEFTLSQVRTITGLTNNGILKQIEKHSLAFTGLNSQRRYPRETVLALLRSSRRGWAPGYRGGVAAKLRRFGRWLAGRCGWPKNPLADLEGSPHYLETDHRHDRRPLTEAEIERLLRSVQTSKRVRCGLKGSDRRILYLVALATGFRRGELAELMPAHCHLDEEPPWIGLPAGDDKAGRTVQQPLPQAVAEVFAEYIAGKSARAAIWPGLSPNRSAAAEMIRLDLADAGIPYITEGPDGPLFADFHGLRHTFVAGLDRAGVTLKQAMQLARHSTPAMTARTYGRASLAEKAAAVERICLPVCLPAGKTEEDRT